MERFAGKTVVVTGAGSGFGAATARRFAAEGASVVVADLDDENAAKVAGGIGGQAVQVHVDVSDGGSVASMIAAAEARFGGVDVLINNAGLSRPRNRIHETPEDDFDHVMSVNVKGVFLGIKHGVPALQRRGGGVILNTASLSALMVRKGTTVYAASKSAVITLTKGAAMDLAPGIRVNCVCPVAADTAFLAGTVGGDPSALEAKRAAMRAHGARDIPMGRLVEPEEIAAALAFLASDDARFITGVALPVDGGRLAGDSSN